MQNKKKFKFHHREAIQKAVDYFGSLSELARKLDTSPGHICNWLTRDHYFPPEQACKIEELTLGHVKKEDLCPHVFAI